RCRQEDGRENREGHKEARRLELVGRGRTRIQRRGGRLCRELAPLRAHARAGQEFVWMVERALGRCETLVLWRKFACDPPRRSASDRASDRRDRLRQGGRIYLV